MTHDNLCLRLEIDRLSLEVERLKMLQVRNDTNSKLKYINHRNKREHCEKRKPGGSADNIKENSAYGQIKEEQLIYISNQDEYSQKSNSRKESEMSIRQIFENEIKCGLVGVTVASAEIASRNGTRLADGSEKEGDFDLIQLHENPSQTMTNDSEFSQCYNAVRTQSAPEIVQASLFVNDT